MDLLDHHQMWEAVYSCDCRYDGIFLYAVKTTKIVCRPSCKSKPPLRENVLFFENLPSAINEGFRPCKRCRPDLLEAPNQRFIVECTQNIIEEKYALTLNLDRLAKEVGVSKFHLQRLFKKSTGYTPQEYLTRVRINHASLLIQKTNDRITDIAHSVGYKSGAHFTDVFFQSVGCSPTDFRKKARGE